MKNALTGTVTAGDRTECLSDAREIAYEYFGHRNVKVTIKRAELREARVLYDGTVVDATFEADFTAT